MHRSEHQYPKDYRPLNGGCHEFPIAVLPDHVHPRIKDQDGRFTVHGSQTCSIEELCPAAVVKIVLNGRVPEHRRAAYQKQTARYFADEAGWAVTQCERFGLRPYPERRIINLLQTLWKKNREILEGRNDSSPMSGVAGSRVDRTYIRRPEDNRIADWIGDDSSRFLVVTGGAASGKTNFMLRAVLSNGLYESCSILYLSLNALELNKQTLLRCVTEYLDVLALPDKAIDVKVLEDMLRDGKIILILDGLDELVRNQGAQCVRELRLQIDHLAEKRSPKIIIACRNHILKWLLERGILAATLLHQRIELSALPSIEIRDQLRLAGCPRNMIDDEVLLAMIGRVPLFYDVLLSSLEAPARPAIGPIQSESDFWKTWIELALSRSGLGVPIDSFCQELGRAATRMLENREDFLSRKDAGDTLFQFFEHLSAKECRLFVKESNDRWRFVHQAIREYALAWNIDFGLTHPRQGSAIKATSSLDYESAETYLYLKTIRNGVGLESVVTSLGCGLDEVAGSDEEWNNFARNYFEAVGMLGVRGDALACAVEQALKILERTTIHRKVSFRTRFNAARCLTRLHFSSPTVYSHHVTRPHRETYLSGTLVYGYAVRGFHQRSHVTGSQPPELLLNDICPERTDPMRHLTAELERRVSTTLLETIKTLSDVEQLHPDGVFVQVNCSHALIRWMSSDDDPAVRSLLGAGGLSDEVRGNILLALACRGDVAAASQVEATEADGYTSYAIKDLGSVFPALRATRQAVRLAAP